jgi:cytochrome c oxidase assembly protein subunit 15
VQFEHRMTAYALFVLAVLHALDAIRSRAGAPRSTAPCGWRRRSRCRRRSAFSRCSIRCRSIWRLAHQAVAIAVLTLAVFQAERLAARQPERLPRELVLPLGQPG